MIKSVVLLAWGLAGVLASQPAQSPLMGSNTCSPQSYCVTNPPQGQCYTAQVCIGGSTPPTGGKHCDRYTVTRDKLGNIIDEKCTMDPNRPKCGRQADGLTCDPHNGYGACCSEDGYCGTGDAFCKIEKPCETCPVTGGCQSGPCTPLPPTTPENTCGQAFGGKLCDPAINAGKCCSKEGTCGNTPAHCGDGCQSGCTNGTSVSNRCGVDFDHKTCPSGQCCSSQGYCGNTENHCGLGCQSGQCTAPPPDNRCGTAFGGKQCSVGECCSKDGYCGNTGIHCGTGCQSGACTPPNIIKPPKCDAGKPNQILACPCKPGEDPIWQTVENAPCTSSVRCNDPCPDVHGAVQTINSQSYTWNCQQAYSSPNKIFHQADSLLGCGKACSARSDCFATNFWTDLSPDKRCTLHLTSGDLVDGASTTTGKFGGALIRGGSSSVGVVTPSEGGAATTKPISEEDSKTQAYKGASWSSICNDGPTYLLAGDRDDNPNRRLITIGGETYILWCNTQTNAFHKIHYVSNPWECAEACSRDSTCLGAAWIYGQNFCYYLQKGGSPTLWEAPNWGALYKKTENGKTTTCIRQHAFNPLVHEPVSC